MTTVKKKETYYLLFVFVITLIFGFTCKCHPLKVIYVPNIIGQKRTLKYFLKSNPFLNIEKYQNLRRLFLSSLNLHIS